LSPPPNARSNATRRWRTGAKPSVSSPKARTFRLKRKLRRASFPTRHREETDRGVHYLFCTLRTRAFAPHRSFALKRRRSRSFVRTVRLAPASSRRPRQQPSLRKMTRRGRHTRARDARHRTSEHTRSTCRSPSRPRRRHRRRAR